jgi:peptidoglycan/LPS O-acetylase OafA/YrhL
MSMTLLLDQHPDTTIASTSTKASSRDDIDGLRAIAAFSVVAFHAGVPGFSGGFIGVDIFFVISGFLITSSIVRREQSGRFTALDFFERRARRLAGAFLVVVVLTWIAAWAMFMPPDYEAFLSSVRGSATLLANHHFYNTLGYFDPGHLTKPLLHVWSLAIEEQFYIAIAGVFFVAALKVWRLAIVVGLLVVSLIASAVTVMLQPDAAFYLLPFRAWELLAGVALALWSGRGRFVEVNARAFALAAPAALLCLVAAIVLYDPALPFPGLGALPPVLLAVLLILSGERPENTTSRILAIRPMVLVGRRSYAIYLIHWPLIVFATYYLDRDLQAHEILGVLIATLVLAELSWHLVERPIERRKIAAFRAETLVASLLLLSCLYFATRLPITGEPLVANVDPAAVALASGRSDWTGAQTDCVDRMAERVAKSDVCRLGSIGGPRVLLWGDSHASAVLPAVEKAVMDLGLELDVITHNGCPPLPSISTARPTCRPVNDAVLDLLTRTTYRVVILAANWQAYGPSNEVTFAGATLSKDAPELTASLLRAIDAIRMDGAAPLVVGQVPVYERDVPTTLAKRSYYSGLDRFFGFDRETPQPTLESAYLDRAVIDRKLLELNPGETLCRLGNCSVRDGAHSLYTDRSHLSRHGAAELAPAMMAAIISALREAEQVGRDGR